MTLVLDMMVPSGTVRYMTSERRPRIPADQAEFIDSVRGDRSFESFVRDALWLATATYVVEPDPDVKGRFRIRNDGTVIAGNLGERQAQYGREDIAHCARAINSLAILEDNLEAAGNPELQERVAALLADLEGVQGVLTSIGPVA